MSAWETLQKLSSIVTVSGGILLFSLLVAWIKYPATSNSSGTWFLLPHNSSVQSTMTEKSSWQHNNAVVNMRSTIRKQGAMDARCCLLPSLCTIEDPSRRTVPSTKPWLPNPVKLNKVILPGAWLKDDLADDINLIISTYHHRHAITWYKQLSPSACIIWHVYLLARTLFTLVSLPLGWLFKIEKTLHCRLNYKFVSS